MRSLPVVLPLFALWLVAAPAQARPYLMLDAGDRGFQALDLGSVDRSRPEAAHATLVEAPLAGAPFGDKLAPMVQRRIEIDCQAARWRVLSQTYVDGREQTLGEDRGEQPWRAFGEDDPVGPAAQAAACRREYRQQLVSRYLNLGDILARYQAAHARPAPQPMTEKERLERMFRNGH